MRIALLSDVHGNRFALEAVLEDIEATKPDLIANLGDGVWGAADPAGAWALQQGLGSVNVRGNTDEMISSGYDNLGEREHAFASWLRSELPADAPDTLGALPLTAELAGGAVVVAHGALHDTWSALLFEFEDGGAVPKPEGALSEGASAFPEARVFVVGHTHRELIRTVAGVTFVNAGPVSRPFDALPAARWVLLEARGAVWSAAFRRVPYDVQAAATWARERSPFGVQEAKMLGVS